METLDCTLRGHDSRSDFSLATPLARLRATVYSVAAARKKKDRLAAVFPGDKVK